MNLNVGIDVSKAKLDYCGLDSAKKVIFQDKTTNTPDGAGQIEKLILEWAKRQSRSLVNHLGV